MSVKRILVIAQYYYPEPFRVTDTCEALAEHGYDVYVVTSVPNYPEGKVYSGYRHGEHRDEVVNGVNVHRCSVIPRKHGVLFRFLNYYSFVIRASRYVRSKNCRPNNAERFDLVFVNETSPIMMAEPAIAYRQKFKVPILLYSLDLWPESLGAGGVSPSSPIYKYYTHVSRWIYRSVDRILVSSKSFSNRLQTQFQIDKAKVEYLPQYAEAIFEPTRMNHGGKISNILFAGNVGKIQGLETVLGAAEILREEPVEFSIVGSGSDLERLRGIANKHNLSNVVFCGRHDVNEMPQFYANADALLVTMAADPLISMTLPGKVQSYMAAGKPIIGAIDGETQMVIKDANCGYCGNAEDSEALAENIRRFIYENRAVELGRNARKYYEQNFSKKKFMSHLTQAIENIGQ